jgi:hypothetical protein
MLSATRWVALLLARETGATRTRFGTIASQLETEIVGGGRRAHTAWHEIPLARPMTTD